MSWRMQALADWAIALVTWLAWPVDYRWWPPPPSPRQMVADIRLERTWQSTRDCLFRD